MSCRFTSAATRYYTPISRHATVKPHECYASLLLLQESFHSNQFDLRIARLVFSEDSVLSISKQKSLTSLGVVAKPLLAHYETALKLNNIASKSR